MIVPTSATDYAYFLNSATDCVGDSSSSAQTQGGNGGNNGGNNGNQASSSDSTIPLCGGACDLGLPVFVLQSPGSSPVASVSVGYPVLVDLNTDG